MGSLRVAAAAVVTCDGAGTIHRPGAVEVEDGVITWVGPADSGEGLLLPGLVNCHCHSPMTLFRGAAEDVPLDRFLREVLWPREAQLTDEDVYWGMTLASAELLRAGVTTTCEMYVHEEPLLRAVVDAGARCVLTPGVMDVPGWLAWRDRLAEVLAFVDTHAHERVTMGIAAHSAYTLPPEALDAIAAAALERDLLVHIHIAETREEWTGAQSVPALLAERGFLDERVLAAHSVWLSDNDLDLYAVHDVAVAHCPQSNAKLAAGIARLSELLARGLRVGLGTDGPSSNNDLDLWDEVRLAPLLAKLQTGDAAAVPATEALRSRPPAAQPRSAWRRARSRPGATPTSCACGSTTRSSCRRSTTATSCRTSSGRRRAGSSRTSGWRVPRSSSTVSALPWMSNVRRTRFRLALAVLPAASALAGCGGHRAAGFCGLVRTGSGFDPVAAVRGISCADALRTLADVERDWTCSRAMHAAYELDCRAPGREVQILESVPVRATRRGDEVLLANWRFRLRGGRLQGRGGGGWVDLGGAPYCVTAAPQAALVALGLRPTTPAGGCFSRK